MSRFTSWRRPLDEEESVHAKPSFRPTFHVGPGLNLPANKPLSSGRPKPMPVRLCFTKPQMGKHGLHKSPQPQRIQLKYINTPEGKKLVRRNIENQQFDLQQTSTSVGVSSRKKTVSGSKIPCSKTSKSRALKQLDVNQDKSAMPKLAEPKCSTSSSPLVSLEEFGTHIAGEANAFKASQEIRNGNKYDLRSIALRNASSRKQNSTATSATTNLGSFTPLLYHYSRVNANIPDSPTLLFSVKKTSSIKTEALDYLKKQKLSKSTRPKFTATSAKKKPEFTITQKNIGNEVSFHIDIPAESQRILIEPNLQNTPMDEDHTEQTSVSSDLLQYKLDERMCLKSSPDNPLTQNNENIVENVAKQDIFNNEPEVLATNSREFVTFVRNLKDDQEKQIEIHRKQVEVHQMLVALHQEAMEVHQKSLKSFQDFISMQMIPLPGPVSFIPDSIQEKESLIVNDEPQSVTKKRRSLRIAARCSGGISVCPPADVCLRVEDWLVTQPTLGLPSSITSTNANLHQSILVVEDNANKTLPIKIGDISDKKTLAKSRQSVSMYRMLQSSFNGLLKTPMKTPVTKSARKVLLRAVETPSELSRRVQASLELLHDVDDTVN